MTAHIQRHVIGITTLVVIYMLGTVIASAAVIRVGDTYTHGIESDVYGDTYLIGEAVSVHGSSTDDLFIFAGTGDVPGRIGGDLFGAAGTMHISAPVAGDVRVAGGEIYITGEVTEDVLIFGGKVIIEESARIGGDTLIYAEYVELHGTIQGSADIYARSVLLTGTTQGSVRVEANESLSFREEAVLGNDLTYRTPREIMIPEGVSITGNVVHEPMEVSRGVQEEAEWPGLLFRILMSLTAGIILLKLFPAFTRSASERAVSGNGTIALVGLAVLVSVPVLAVLLMITFLAFIPGLFLFLAYSSVVVFACALAPILAGAALASWLKKEDGQKWHWMSLGAGALTLLTLVPVVGWIVRLLVFLTAFGVTVLLIHERVWKHRKKDAVASAALLTSDALATNQGEHHEENNERITKEPAEENAK